MEPDFDVLVVGSGFGGSVSALRLTEKGWVGVLEAAAGSPTTSSPELVAATRIPCGRPGWAC